MEELMHFPPRSEVRALFAKFDPSSFDSERDAYDLTMAPDEHGFILDGFAWMDWDESRANADSISQIEYSSLPALHRPRTTRPLSLCLDFWRNRP